MGRKEIIKQLRSFKNIINKDMSVSKIIFFGSRATGKPHRDSDIDLIIVSPAFRERKSFKRGVELYKYWDLDYPVDFLCYTPEEYNKLRKQVSIVSEAVKKGIEI